jgi:hypothetical protein
MFKIPFYIIIFFSCINLFSQTYTSKKQIIIDENNNEIVSLTTNKIIINDTLINIEIPNGNDFLGVVYFYDETLDENNFLNKIYKINGGGIVNIGKDNIFVNLRKKRNSAYTFYLDNYIEPTKEEKEKIKADKIRKEKGIELKILDEFYSSLKKDFDDFTIECVKIKSVKIGMNENAVFLILGKAKSINITETKNLISKQFIYNSKYIYTQNGFVTSIQSSE